MGYKTFEDMKRDIPEGATHYHNESDGYHFCWFKFDGENWFICCPDKGGKWYTCYREQYRDGIVQFVQTETPQEREALDMIDTTSKQVESLAKGDAVEWKNGDSLLWKNGNGEFLECNTGRYIGYDSVENKHIFVRTDVDTYYIMYAKHSAISKPESQEQKAERERLEAAYNLYIAGQESLGVNDYQSFQQFTSDKVQVRFWLGVAGTAGYRKVKQ